MPKRVPKNWWHKFTDWFWGAPLWISKHGHKVRSNEKNGPIYVWPNGQMYRDVNDWGPDIYSVIKK